MTEAAARGRGSVVMAKRNKNDPSKVAPVPLPVAGPGAPVTDTRIGIQSRLHHEDLTAHVLENAPEAATALEEAERADAERIESIVKVLHEIAQGDSIQNDTRVDACDVLCKLFGGPDEVAERVLLKHLGPPSDYRNRVRAARLLLGL